MAKRTQTEIEKLKIKLQAWRQRKKGKTEQIPVPILKDLCKLTRAHSPGDLGRQLSLSHSIFKSQRFLKMLWDQQIPLNTNLASKSEWVEVPSKDLIAKKIGSSQCFSKVWIESPKGHRMEIAIGDSHQFQDLMTLFLGGA